MHAKEQVVNTLMAVWVLRGGRGAPVWQNEVDPKTWLYWSARGP